MRKLDQQEELVCKVYERVNTVGKGDSILPYLHETLALCSSCLEKVNTEAARLGLIKRKLQIPEPTILSTLQELAEMVTKHYMVCSKLFKMVLEFAQRYMNDSYQVTLVVNMNRLRSAEIDLNEMLKTTKELV